MTTALPLILSLLAGFTLLALTVRNHTILSASCRSAAFSAQAEMARLLDQLLRLNPRAATLRKQRQMVEKEVTAARATGIPPLIAAAEAHRIFVIGQQLTLQAEQRALLLKARQVRLQTTGEVTRRLPTFDLDGVSAVHANPSLAVRASPPLDLSPSYQVEQPLLERQNLTLRFGSDLLSHRPEWLRLSTLSRTLSFKVKCASTLKQEGNRWLPVLATAKF